MYVLAISCIKKPWIMNSLKIWSFLLGFVFCICFGFWVSKILPLLVFFICYCELQTKPYWEKDLFLFQMGVIVMVVVLFIKRGIGAELCFDWYFDDHSWPITGFVMYLKLLSMFLVDHKKKSCWFWFGL